MKKAKNTIAKRGREEVKEEEKEREFNFTRGLIVQLKNIGPNVLRNEIKEAISMFGKVAFIEHDSEAPEKPSFVRMTTIEDAAKTVENVNRIPLEFGGQVVSAELVTGEAEDKYWEKVKEFTKIKSMANKKSKKFGKRAKKW